MDLESHGVALVRTSVSSASSISVAGVPISLASFRGERLSFTLPVAPTLQLAFTREVFGSGFAKLVWPEITLGDPEFDDVVLARTTTEPTTRLFLDDPEARMLVIDVIAEGGAVTVEGRSVTVMVAEDSAVDEDRITAFVAKIAST